MKRRTRVQNMEWNTRKGLIYVKDEWTVRLGFTDVDEEKLTSQTNSRKQAR
jgi:hypothetical protein